MRKISLPEVSNKAIMETVTAIKRASYLADLETKFCIALNCDAYTCSEGTPFFMTLQDYIEIFFDKGYDVINDVMPFLKLLNTEDMFSLKDKIEQKLETLTQTLMSAFS